jgi:predicted ester cyclase
MSVEKNKALVRRWFEECNKGKAASLAAVDKMFASDCIIHSSSGRDYRGAEEYKKYASDFPDAFPDYHQSIDDIFAEGDKVAVRITKSGTHTGGCMGIPPTNKKTTGWAIQIIRIVGDKFVEVWSRRDTLAFMQQLGLIPAPKRGT